MALKFLNKKGWHTGSLRNIENVWKAEQKQEAEQKKLDELRKQILEERERSEFRLLQEQAGLVPHQERLDFLYDSGLSVGKSSSEGFKALESLPRPEAEASSSSKQAAVPGALFEDKPQSANDAWRKLHSDPLLMIRQKEQEALARIKNNPVKMAMIRKSVEAKKHKEAAGDEERKAGSKLRDDDADHKKVRSKHRDDDDVKKHGYKHRDEDDGNHRSKYKYEADDKDHKKARSKHRGHTSSKNHSDTEDEKIRVEYRGRERKREDDDFDDRLNHRHRSSHGDLNNGKQSERSRELDRRDDIASRDKMDRYDKKSKHDKSQNEGRTKSSRRDGGTDANSHQASESNHSTTVSGGHGSKHSRGYTAPKLSEEERDAKLREMEADAQIHEEQRWKRLKKAAEDDAREARSQAGPSFGPSFLDDANKSIYGAEKGGSSTIEESVRRRAYFNQGRSQSDERNAFRRLVLQV
ncbi:hypothetical protein Droror1_Dr00017009 [Drosera rotundifolia]